MRCIICEATIIDSENKCVKCGSPTAWSLDEPCLFAFSSKDVSILKKARQSEIEKQKHIRKENKTLDELKVTASKAVVSAVAAAQKSAQEQIETERKKRKKEHIISGSILILLGIVNVAVVIYNTYLKLQTGHQLMSNDYWELGIPAFPIISGIIDLYYAKR